MPILDQSKLLPYQPGLAPDIGRKRALLPTKAAPGAQSEHLLPTKAAPGAHSEHFLPRKAAPGAAVRECRER